LAAKCKWTFVPPVQFLLPDQRRASIRVTSGSRQRYKASRPETALHSRRQAVADCPAPRLYKAKI
jgi:hypothetical protein